METSQSENKWIVPASIIAAGLLVAGAIIYSNRPSDKTQAGVEKSNKELTVQAVTADDHILGSPSAKVVMIEYSDTECPYCQVFMPTMKQIMNEYGKSGQVAWVYRHFTVHPKAPLESQATECAAELGGNDAFWAYLDALFAKKNFRQNPYLGIESSELPKIAAALGLNEKSFTACLDSGKYSAKIESQYKDALASGGEGTPHTVIVSGKTKVNVEGAQSYDYLKSVIDQMLKN